MSFLPIEKVVIGVIGSLILLIAIVPILEIKDKNEQRKILAQYEYNVDEVMYFLDIMDADARTFVISPALQAQYENFKAGDTSFVTTAQIHEAKEQAQAAKNSAAFATGMAAGSIAMSGSR